MIASALPLLTSPQELWSGMYTARLQPQHDQELVSIGPSGQIYNIAKHGVLKFVIFEQRSSDTRQSHSAIRFRHSSTSIYSETNEPATAPLQRPSMLVKTFTLVSVPGCKCNLRTVHAGWMV